MRDFHRPQYYKHNTIKIVIASIFVNVSKVLLLQNFLAVDYILCEIGQLRDLLLSAMLLSEKKIRELVLYC